MAQQLMALATKADDLSSVPETHVVQGENRLLQVVQTHRQHTQTFSNKNIPLMWILVARSPPLTRITWSWREVVLFVSSYLEFGVVLPVCAPLCGYAAVSCSLQL